MQIGEGVAIPVPIAGEAAEPPHEERHCPVCNALWQLTEPTLPQVRTAAETVINNHRPQVKALSADSICGYVGSIASGRAGNPNKPHFGMEPDIRGECGNHYDIDGYIITQFARRVPKRGNKRWASANRDTRNLERQIRSALQGCPELAYMKPGKEGFSIVLYLPTEQSIVIAKTPRVVIT